MKIGNTAINKKTFFVLWILCIMGSWSVLPYVLSLGGIPSTVSIGKLVFSSTIQSILIFGLLCWLSFKLLPKTDLRPFSYRSFLREIAYPGVISGVVVGVVLFLFDKTVFHSSLLSGSEMQPPFWTGALGSIYGGVNEEVLLRLFLFTLIYFLFSKAIKIREGNRLTILWSVNILVALLFGAGHLPAAFKLAPPSAFEIFRVLFLNGLAGVVFGWLYFSRGFWTAVASHFVADLVIHVFLV